jgi:hypothetical protein
MLQWLRENPRGKQGRNTYTIEEFGPTHDIIKQRYEAYNNMFLKPRDSSETHNHVTKVRALLWTTLTL